MARADTEGNEISLQEVRVFQALLHSKEWLTNTDITTKVGNVSARAVRNYTKKFLALGLLDVAEVFPAHKFKWSEKAAKRNAAYLNRLVKAEEVFKLPP